MPLSDEVLASRWEGLSLLRGAGIEIGAFDQPSRLPEGAGVQYLDAFSRDESIKLFPEVDPTRIVNPDLIVDLDRDGLAPVRDGSLDFVIACHVLEHVANPIGVIAEGFRVIKPDGLFAIAIPDKRFNFDKPRNVTPFEHVWQDYLNRTTSSDDGHYVDFLSAVIPIHTLPKEEWGVHIVGARNRREHVHVWDSDAFSDLLLLSLPLCGIRAKSVYASAGDQNRFEYFAVWRKISQN